MDPFSSYKAPSNLSEDPSQCGPGFGNYRQETHTAGNQARSTPAGSRPQRYFQRGPAYRILRQDSHTVRPQDPSPHGPAFGTYSQDTHTARHEATIQYGPGFGRCSQDTHTKRRQANTQHDPGFGSYGRDTHTATLQAQVTQLKWILQSKVQELDAAKAEKTMWEKHARTWANRARELAQFTRHRSQESKPAARLPQLAGNLYPIVDGGIATGPRSSSHCAVQAPTAPTLQANGVTAPSSSPVSPSATSLQSPSLPNFEAPIAPALQAAGGAASSSSPVVIDLTSPPASPITGKCKRSLEDEQPDSRAAFYEGLGQKSLDWLDGGNPLLTNPHSLGKKPRLQGPIMREAARTITPAISANRTSQEAEPEPVAALPDIEEVRNAKRRELAKRYREKAKAGKKEKKTQAQREKEEQEQRQRHSLEREAKLRAERAQAQREKQAQEQHERHRLEREAKLRADQEMRAAELESTSRLQDQEPESPPVNGYLMLELFGTDDEEDTEDSQMTDAEVDDEFAAQLEDQLDAEADAHDALAAELEVRLEPDADDELAAEPEAQLDAEEEPAESAESAESAEPEESEESEEELWACPWVSTHHSIQK